MSAIVQSPIASGAIARRLRVVVIDDSAQVRRMTAGLIGAEPDMEVVADGPGSLLAREGLRALAPDVITLSVETLKAWGPGVAERLLRLCPAPVVMVSPAAGHAAEAAVHASQSGALDPVALPGMRPASGATSRPVRIAEGIRSAAGARALRRAPAAEPARGSDTPPPRPGGAVGSETLIIIGASTGGTEAIRDVLEPLPADVPGIVIAQHMPEAFTGSFARRLDSVCRITVKQAEQGERILRGHAYIAPGHSHLRVRRSGTGYVAELSQDLPVNRHRPSVDVLFRSAASQAGRSAIGVILTGMGKDGAAGMREMKDAGAATIAQDEQTCVVFGMPKEAIARGGVDEVLPLGGIARAILFQVAARGGRHTRA